ncbi:uncharacterized protein Gasu_15020 [Galdieria sulphuraria]|uniref:BZIP domain-containing protein n=1 Tax=Galdieria sulphuraria TaxID=130081 RepID=M2XM38_GALSU|nr:uncharacterized protein Gasu_15020 [Galdieria sulphuraria]EME31262.1 hypothetical protein Gasu_15020 [Galdieria sulphuraria]|eukprot:XP_005707782.1 hypothetical protein Gasu_15020 [Galdieria sulphuraria]
MEHHPYDTLDLCSLSSTSSYFYENIPCGGPYGDGCGELFSKASIPGHELFCDAIPVPCPFSGCDQRPARKELVSHELNCSFLPVPCIHEGCVERPRKIDLSSHLEACEACDTRNEDGHCAHIDQLDAFLAEILGEHPHTSFSEYFSDVSSNYGSQRDFWEDCLSKDWHSEEKVRYAQCENVQSIDIKKNLDTGPSAVETLADMGTESSSWNTSNCSAYSLNQIVDNTETSTESKLRPIEKDRYVVVGQPPVFSPPPCASKDEVRLLRQKHLESLKNLTPEERLERRKMRNRQNAVLSRKKRYERLEHLKRRRQEVKERLQQLASYMTDLRKYALELHERRDKCIFLLYSIRQLTADLRR